MSINKYTYLHIFLMRVKKYILFTFYLAVSVCDRKCWTALCNIYMYMLKSNRWKNVQRDGKRKGGGVVWPFQLFCCFPGVSHPFPKSSCGVAPIMGDPSGLRDHRPLAWIQGRAGCWYCSASLEQRFQRKGMPEACRTPAEELPGN